MDSFAQKRVEICDLPVEIIDIIFNYLTIYELKQVSLVCLQWSHLAFSGRRMDRIRFMPKTAGTGRRLPCQYAFNEQLRARRDRACVSSNVKHPTRLPVYSHRIQTLFEEKKSFSEGQREYRHIGLECGIPDENIHIEFIEAIQRFQKNVTSFNVSGKIVLPQIQRILVEVPNLKALSLTGIFLKHKFEDIVELPVFHQLYDLKIRHCSSILEKSLDICTIAPDLQSISIDCLTKNAIKVFSHFRHQLQSVKAAFNYIGLVDSFCEISFPQLLEIEFDIPYAGIFSVSRTNSAFLAGSKRLQRATLKYAKAAQAVNILVENCRDITFLHIGSDKLENQCLNGLVNLTKLNILKLEGKLDCNVFEECQPISSLQELHLVCKYKEKNTLEFFKGLPTVMPNLDRLCTSNCVDDDCLLFICSNMLSLKRLELTGGWISERGVQHFDRLPHLIELKLDTMYISYGLLERFPSTKVKTLLIFYCCVDEDELLSIPAVFPSLQMLHVRDGNARPTDCIEKLRSLMPLCTVIVSESSE